MTGISPLSIPASGASARPTTAAGDGARNRAIDPVGPARQRQSDSPAPERRAASDAVNQAHQSSPPPAAVFVPPPLSADGPSESRGPQEWASDAYRKAGAEPPRYSEEPRLFSVRV